ncbi:MAG: DNA cytosine methyltransferase, partial [Acidobacteria bacterium]|nr:DNA cytosine methyltransferase [Acidobacteriota bacterium]
MDGPTVGSLFSGYDGIGLAVKMLWPEAVTRWVSDIEDGPRRVLAHRFPDAPNLGDITTIDWLKVEPVDIITGGSPCPDLSHAGKRKGMRAGTRSGLWASMCDAIDTLRPSLVIWENVQGAYSACADSDSDSELGYCPRCLDPASGVEHAPNLRALARVLGDLAEIGYDATWVGLRAADVGACHGRFRVFVVAYPTESEGVGWDGAGPAWSGGPGLADGDRGTLRLLPTATGQDAASSGGAEGSSNITLTDALVRGRSLPTPRATRGGSTTETLALLPSPRASDDAHSGPNQRGSKGDLTIASAIALLPTPAVNDMGAGKEPDAWDAWDAWTDDMRERHGNGNGHGKSLAIEARRVADGLLPTPGVADSTGGHHSRSGARSDELLLNGIAHHDRWGDYAEAITRHGDILGRPAPSPTLPSGKGGKAQLSP